MSTRGGVQLEEITSPPGELVHVSQSPHYIRVRVDAGPRALADALARATHAALARANTPSLCTVHPLIRRDGPWIYVAAELVA